MLSASGSSPLRLLAIRRRIPQLHACSSRTFVRYRRVWMPAGFEREGFTPALAVEWETRGRRHLRRELRRGAHLRGGHREIQGRRHPPCLGGGRPPACQGFSSLGDKNPGDSRNKLWREYIRFVKAARPRVFVLENVDRFASSPEFAMLRHAVESGALGDYRLTRAVLNAADYGVPQRQRRTIVMGARVGEPTLPDPTHAKDGAAEPLLRVARPCSLTGTGFGHGF